MAKGSLLYPDQLLLMYRNRAELTQARLGDLLGLSKRTILNWEAGYNLPRPETLKKVLELFVVRAVFSPSLELEEARQLWETVKDLYDRKNPGGNLYPVFDQHWFQGKLMGKQVLSNGINPVSPTVNNSATSSSTYLPQHNLPSEISSFIGREKELAETKALLQSHRLLTLTGSGGVGKTRLALRLATELLPDFPDGAWLVELAPLSSPHLVPHIVAQVLGLVEPQSGSLFSAISGFLRKKSLLLVLDNCEHLIEACAGLTETLLKACPTLKVLATSRETLAVQGEVAWRVPSLSLPPRLLKESYSPIPVISLDQLLQYEAPRLLFERARTANPSLDFLDEQVGVISELCFQLDAIPLAIELAAARLNALTIEQLVTRLGYTLEARTRALGRAGRKALPRHQTVHTLIEWSYNLLSEPEKALLRYLSVFSGGISLEAAEEMAGSLELPGKIQGSGLEVLDVLLSLVNKSMVVAEQAQTGEVARYRLLEMVRQFGQAKLGETGELTLLKDLHLDYFVNWVEVSHRKLVLGAQKEWYAQLNLELDNLRAALDFSLNFEEEEGDPDRATLRGMNGLRICIKLGEFWSMKGLQTEGRKWFELALLRNPQAPPELRGQALRLVGLLAIYHGHYSTAIAHLMEALALLRGENNKGVIALTLANLGYARNSLGQDAEARENYLEALTLFRESGDVRGQMIGLRNLGILLLGNRKYDEAKPFLEEALAFYRQVGNSDSANGSSVLGLLGLAAEVRGDLSLAFEYYREALLITEQVQANMIITAGLKLTSSLAARLGEWEKAVRLITAATRVRDELGFIWPVAISRYETAYDENLARHKLGNQAFEAAVVEGRAMTIHEAIVCAFSLGQNSQISRSVDLKPGRRTRFEPTNK